MKLTKRAKQKWFKEHVNSFELYYYDAIHNHRLAEYNYFDGLYKEQDSYCLYCFELKQMARELQKLPAWEIFFKYKKLRFQDHRKKDIFKFYYD